MTATDKPIHKLPRWAQEHIATLQRQRDAAVSALDDFCNEQKPAPVWFDDFVSDGVKSGVTDRRRYIQAHRIEIEWAGVAMSVLLVRKDDGQREYGIEVTASNGRRSSVPCAMIPRPHGVYFVTKENMRD